MENGNQRILLRNNWLCAAIAVVCMALGSQSNAQDYDKAEEERTILDAVISPDLERREITEDKIDSENIEIGVYGGVLGVEDFGSNNVFGVRVSFHISEDWFIEANYATSETSESSAEFLGNFALLTDDERDLTYYNASLGINLFPGEVFVGKNRSFNTNYYVIGGVGNTEFANDEFLTYSFGGGFKLFATDWIALQIDFRNYLFTHSIFGQDKSIQNLESSLGISFFF